VQLIQSRIRPSDVLFRWGGEEFVVLTASAGYRGAERMAQNVCRVVAGHTFRGAGNVTVSVGVAEHFGAEDAKTWFARHNRRFAVEPAEPDAAWRPWPAGVSPEAVLCFAYPRRAARDATVGWDGGSLALPRRVGGASWAGRRILVQERLDGSLWARDGDHLYPLAEAPPTAPVLRARKSHRVEELADPPEPRLPVERAPSAASTAGHTPARSKADHPWRRYPAVRPKPR